MTTKYTTARTSASFFQPFITAAVILVLPLSQSPARAQLRVGTPQLTPGSINSSGQNIDPAFSSDGLRMYFASTRTGTLGGADIWYADRASTSDPWGPASQLDLAINSTIAEGGPNVSATGLELFFHRGNTSGLSNSLEIMVSRRPSAISPWGVPEPVQEVNSPYGDGWPVLSANGLSLYFTSQQPGDPPTSGSTYVSTRPSLSEPFGIPALVFYGGSLEEISSDELTAFVDSDTLGGFGLLDIFLVSRASTNDNFDSPVNLGPPINTALNEFSSKISPDGKTYYFSSNRSGSYLIWEAPILPDCDFNSDVQCDITDLNTLLLEGPVAPGVAVVPGVNDQFDLTGNGVIDNQDVDAWLALAATENGLSSPYKRGDGNLDGIVDGTDFGVWNAHKFMSTLLWDQGNFNGDAVADGGDFGIWNMNKFTSSDGTSAVPEPAAGCLCLVLGLYAASSLVRQRAFSPSGT